ncbi:uncharacterized protein LOC125828079 [Solanum verrucosum]|uniref:uncharacterized protein LOC125828079 n=1 Tax=Solanum verrucosum TaxID=315347 RepID=UPI0020D0272F|nr:uncharacterized protein LOC125828079 [Solanum verrucosum]
MAAVAVVVEVVMGDFVMAFDLSRIWRGHDFGANGGGGGGSGGGEGGGSDGGSCFGIGYGEGHGWGENNGGGGQTGGSSLVPEEYRAMVVAAIDSTMPRPNPPSRAGTYSNT